MDIRFEDHGTIWLVRHKTDAGRAWLHEHVDFQQRLGHAGIV